VIFNHPCIVSGALIQRLFQTVETNYEGEGIWKKVKGITFVKDITIP